MANELKHTSVGTVMTQAESEAVGLHVLDSQATGDLIYASSASQLSRLAIGSTNAVLTVIGGVPTWQTVLSGLALAGYTISENSTINKSIIQEYVVSSTSITSWTTVKTITPSAVSGIYTRGLVECWLGGSTVGVGNGVKRTYWYFDVNNGAPTAAEFGSDVNSGTPSDMRLNISGNNIQIQLQSNNGVGAINGTAFIRIFLPTGSGTFTWSVS